MVYVYSTSSSTQKTLSSRKEGRRGGSSCQNCNKTARDCLPPSFHSSAKSFVMRGKKLPEAAGAAANFLVPPQTEAREGEREREREGGESEVSECSREKQQGMKCILWKLKCKCTWPAIRAQPDMKPAGRLRWIERVQKRTRAKRPLGCERL